MCIYANYIKSKVHIIFFMSRALIRCYIFSCSSISSHLHYPNYFLICIVDLDYTIIDDFKKNSNSIYNISSAFDILNIMKWFTQNTITSIVPFMIIHGYERSNFNNCLFIENFYFKEFDVEINPMLLLPLWQKFCANLVHKYFSLRSSVVRIIKER